MTCQPVYAGIRQGTTGRRSETPCTEHQPRCVCGWAGHWWRHWADVYEELGAHLARERRPL